MVTGAEEDGNSCVEAAMTAIESEVDVELRVLLLGEREREIRNLRKATLRARERKGERVSS